MRPPRVAPPNPHTTRTSGDRWLFGYADVVTLLLACFATLYATSLAPAAAPDTDVAEPTVEVQPAEAPVAPPAPAGAEAPVAPPAPAVAALSLQRALETRLSRDGHLPALEVTASARGVVISLPETGSFPPGRAELSLSARVAMLELAGELRGLPNLVRVEGHTDDVPIRTAEFASNWDLSTARATRVVRFLIEEGRMDPARLAAAGYAEHRPRRPNDSLESRARNRRVDIVVLDESSAGREDPEDARP